MFRDNTGAMKEIHIEEDMPLDEDFYVHSPRDFPSDTLTDFRDFGLVSRTFVPLLEQACSLHPSLTERLHNTSRYVTQCIFTALGELLHFLEQTKVKDIMMCEEEYNILRNLWEDVQLFAIDVTWLKTRVESALGMGEHVQRARKLKRLREDVDALDKEVRKRSVELAATKLHLRDLEKEQEGFVAVDLNTYLARLPADVKSA